jgi:hypothetical protein
MEHFPYELGLRPPVCITRDLYGYQRKRSAVSLVADDAGEGELLTGRLRRPEAAARNRVIAANVEKVSRHTDAGRAPLRRQVGFFRTDAF